MCMKTVYDDGLIAATESALVIRRYSALLQPKSIPYSAIRRVQRLPIGQVRRWRIWGTTIPGYWFNLDRARPRKSVGFVVDAGRPVKPIITPDDPEALVEALRSHDVTVRDRE
jgi:hypothetical protein